MTHETERKILEGIIAIRELPCKRRKNEHCHTCSFQYLGMCMIDWAIYETPYAVEVGKLKQKLKKLEEN